MGCLFFTSEKFFLCMISLPGTNNPVTDRVLIEGSVLVDVIAERTFWRSMSLLRSYVDSLYKLIICLILMTLYLWI